MGVLASWVHAVMGRRMGAGFIFLLGVVLLILSWRFLYGWLIPMTEGLLVPWDTTPTRPPTGTWERSLNDFFEVPPGAYAPSVLVVASSALLFLVRLLTGNEERAKLPWLFALVNGLFFLASIVLLVLTHWLSAAFLLLSGQSHLTAGYQRTLLGIVAMSIAIAFLLLAQASCIRIGRKTGGSLGLRLVFWR